MLSKSDPAAWATFVEAFRAYTAYQCERMARTPVSEMAVSLGMSRQMIEMRDDFGEIEARMEKIKSP